MGHYLHLLLITISISIINNNNCLANGPIQHVVPRVTTKGKLDRVCLSIRHKFVVMDNGILQVSISNTEGFVTGIRYNGVDNLLEVKNEESNRGYFDVVWDAPGRCGNSSNIDCTDWLIGTNLKVISNDTDKLEISFSGIWNEASWNTESPAAPINVDRRYVMFKGFAGYYSYTILERDASYPPANFHQIRAVYKLDRDRFHYMAVSDDRQRIMPMPQDRHKGEMMAYKEAVRLKNPINPHIKGEVDDKYQYSCEDKDNKVHGWIAKKPSIGFWIITPSNEFRTAGPFKQDLSSHVGPTSLQMFHSAHYGGSHMALAFKKGEVWKKVFGPFLVYLNSNDENIALWDDAKRQMMEETKKWPYDFPLSEAYAKPAQRGLVSGRLLVNDRCENNKVLPAINAWIGLAAPGEVGSWQMETKGYQFWVVTGEDGSFVIDGVLEGTYNLYATVLGFIGDYKYETNIQIKAGIEVKLGDLTYNPPRNGPTLWEIGNPDRTAAEFFVPDPNPSLVNKLFSGTSFHKFRQYGLWERYNELYPKDDLVYTIGKSDFRKDWFFAQVTRYDGQTCKPTTWRILFPMESLEVVGTNYTLHIAIASSSNAEVQVRINDPSKADPDFTTLLFGKDNAIARHGIRGLYKLFSMNVPSSCLHLGTNTIYLTQTRCKTLFEGVMYDYIRFEMPPTKA